MASIASRVVRLVARYAIKGKLAKCTTEAEYVATARRVFELGGRASAVAPRDTRVVAIDRDGVRGEWVLPRDLETVDRAILYMHGGAHLACSPSSYRRFAASLARAVRTPVFMLDYRLAPEHPYPAALDDAVAAYRALRAQLGPDAIMFGGDSAGGNLALATLLKLRAGHDGPRPVAGVFTFSPWTDLTASGPSVAENADSDDMIPRGAIDPATIYAAGAPLDDPFLSPLFGAYDGSPPLLAFASTIEVLRDDSVRLVERARAAGVDATLVLEPDMPHVWPIMYPILPEARRAFDALIRFVAACRPRVTTESLFVPALNGDQR